MLSKDHLCELLTSSLDEFKGKEQFLDGYGFDAIISMITSLRTVDFPCVILEGRSTGTVQLVEGPVDSYSQSIWVMDQMGRGEDETAIYNKMYALMIKIIKALIAARKAGDAELKEWNWRRMTYMKRYGGQNARGYELVISFEDNISLV